MRKLLILACSATKSELEAGPAVEIYDGPLWRILRKNADGGDPLTLVLSAKYGLITANTEIETYDRPMTSEKAEAIRLYGAIAIEKHTPLGGWDSVMVMVGKDYRPALPDREWFETISRNVVYGHGGIGERGAQLKRWLLKQEAEYQ